MQDCVYAFTAADPSYPAYVNVSRAGRYLEHDGRLYRITVRNAAKHTAEMTHAECGATACIEVHQETMRALYEALKQEFA